MQLTGIFYLHEIGSKKNQEDYLWPLPGRAKPEDRIFIVCDGVGGSTGGEVASKVVSDTVGAALMRTPLSEAGLPLVNSLLENARRKLVQYASANGLGNDMATTFTLLEFVGEKAFIAWLGDSRVYHLRQDKVLFRTEDHSLVHSLVRKGELTEEEARNHPQKNLLLKAVRADDTKPEAEGQWIEDIQDGDYFLLCTDGVLENMTEADLFFVIEQYEKGTMDLEKGFRLYCHEKTRDNYSLYLLRVRPDNAIGKEVRARKTARRRVRTRIGWLLILLMVLVAAVAFILRENYFTPHKDIDTLVPTNVTAPDTNRQAPASAAHTTDAPRSSGKDTTVHTEKRQKK
jgi:serine/threonine protein phosphatase PrpC